MNKDKYFPERYMNHQRFAKRMIKSFDKKEVCAEVGLCSRLLDFLTKETGQIHKSYTKEYALAYEQIMFWYGRNIFETPPNLVQLLSKTDVDNVRFKDITLPYKEIYIHFGEVKDVAYTANLINQNGEKYYLEGAYITDCGTYFKFTTCYKNPKDDFSKQVNALYDDRFLTFEFSLDCDKPENEMVSKCFIDFHSDQSGMIEEFRYDKIVGNNMNGQYAVELALINKSLKLILNTICYINAFKNDVEITSINKHVAELMHQLGSSKKSHERHILRRKLSKLSYSKIHLLGKNIRAEYDSDSIGMGVEPHWRRGHWRNQPYGKELSDSKLIWIKPTIVRKDKGEPNKGHIYNI